MPSALRDFDSLPDSAFVRQPIVQALFASSAATIWRRVKDGRLPQPRKFSARITAWNVGELRRILGSSPANIKTDGAYAASTNSRIAPSK